MRELKSDELGIVTGGSRRGGPDDGIPVWSRPMSVNMRDLFIENLSDEGNTNEESGGESSGGIAGAINNLADSIGGACIITQSGENGGQSVSGDAEGDIDANLPGKVMDGSASGSIAASQTTGNQSSVITISPGCYNI